MTILRDLPVLTRKDAQERGHYRYYTGRMCKHGHVGWRYTKTGICCECATTRSKASYASAVKPEVQNLAGILVIEVRSSNRNKPLLDDFAFNLSRARWPQIERVDVCPMMAGYQSCGQGTFLYRYHVHGDDADLVANYAKVLLSTRGI